jgi:hypothetical protein
MIGCGMKDGAASAQQTTFAPEIEPRSQLAMTGAMDRRTG